MATARAMLERRRACRLLLQVPVRVSGNSPVGENFHATAVATAVSRCGALLRASVSPAVGSRIEIHHGHSNEIREARVVRIYPCKDDQAYEVAVELFHPAHNFWGVRFPDEQYSS